MRQHFGLFSPQRQSRGFAVIGPERQVADVAVDRAEERGDRVIAVWLVVIE
jgi:hypothetical protein